MRPIIYWNNALSVVADFENLDNEEDGFLELHDGSIGIAAALRPEQSASVSGVAQRWTISGAAPFTREVFVLVSGSAELDGFGIAVSGLPGPGSGYTALYGIISGTGPQVFPLMGQPASGAARVPAKSRWVLDFTQTSGVLLPVGEEIATIYPFWPQLTAVGVWGATGPTLIFAAIPRPESILAWEGHGISNGITVRNVFSGPADGALFYVGRFNVSGFRPAQWEEFTLHHRVGPAAGTVSGATVVVSGTGGSLTWQVPSGQLNQAISGSALLPLSLPVASAALSGSASFVASGMRFTVQHVGGAGVWDLELDALLGTKTSPLPGHPQVLELGLYERLPFPRDHEVGVERTTVLRRTRLTPPGASPIRLREGDDLRQTTYQLTTTRAETASGIQAFLESNDAGTPFLFSDDRGDLYWAELPEPAQVFDDRAGLFVYTLTVREIRP